MIGEPWSGDPHLRDSARRLGAYEDRDIREQPGCQQILEQNHAFVRIIASRILLPYLAPALHIGHKLDVGAERLVKAVTDASLQSGVFYASAASTITGPVIDQAEIVPDFRDPEIQDHAYEAIQRFVPRLAAT